MQAAGYKHFTPMGHEQLAPTTSTALTVPTGARFALMSASVQGIRFTDDGTVPTLTVGVVIPVGAAPLWYAGELGNLLFFNDVADGLLDVLYYS